MTTRAISALVFMLAVASGMAAQCAEIVGRIVKVADGDTLTILSSATGTGTTGVPPVAQHKIRLHGIDAPEFQGDAASRRVVWTHRGRCVSLCIEPQGKSVDPGADFIFAAISPCFAKVSAARHGPK